MTPRRPVPRPLPSRPPALLLAAALLLAPACAEDPPPASPDVVAEIEGEPVRYPEFEAYVERAVGGSGSSLGSEVLSQLFDQFLEERLLLRLAAARGLLPEYAAEAPPRRRRVVDRLLADAAARAGREAPEAAELEAWYEEHRDRYRRPERVRVRQILVEERETAEEALGRLRGGADFADVARDLSIEPGADTTGGAQGELARDELPPAFAEVIFRLQPSEVSGVVEADYGFHVFQVTERLPAEVLPLEAVRDDVERALRQERADRSLDELVAEARGRYDVSVWDRNLPFNYRGRYLAESG